MKFTSKSFENHEVNDDLWGDVKNVLDGLTAFERRFVKVASSDRQESPSRAVIIYATEQKPSFPGGKEPSSPNREPTFPEQKYILSDWSYKSFTQASNEAESAYTSCVDFLNSDTLTDLQKYYARLSMYDKRYDNEEGTDVGDFEVLLWFPGTIQLKSSLHS